MTRTNSPHKELPTLYIHFIFPRTPKIQHDPNQTHHHPPIPHSSSPTQMVSFSKLPLSLIGYPTQSIFQARCLKVVVDSIPGLFLYLFKIQVLKHLKLAICKSLFLPSTGTALVQTTVLLSTLLELLEWLIVSSVECPSLNHSSSSSRVDWPLVRQGWYCCLSASQPSWISPDFRKNSEFLTEDFTLPTYLCSSLQFLDSSLPRGKLRSGWMLCGSLESSGLPHSQCSAHPIFASWKHSFPFHISVQQVIPQVSA